MNRPLKRDDDKLARVAMIVTLSPLVVALGLMIAGCVLEAGARNEVAGLFAVFALALVVAAGAALAIFDRAVLRDMRRVADYLRAARHGEAGSAPLGIGGLLAEILEAAEDVVQNQIQLARTLSHMDSVERLRESMERTAGEQRSRQASISRALQGLSDDLKLQSRSPAEARVEAIAIADAVGARVSRIFAEQRVPARVMSDLDGVQQSVREVRKETGAIGAGLKTLGQDLHAHRGVLETLKGLMEAKAQPVATDALEARLSLPLRELGKEIDRGFAEVSTRLDRIADPAPLQTLERGVREQGRRLDQWKADMAQDLSGLKSFLSSHAPQLSGIDLTTRRIAASLEGVRQIKSLGPDDLQPLLARLEGLAKQVDGVGLTMSGAPAMLTDIRSALAEQKAAGVTQAAVAETMARGIEMILANMKEEQLPEAISQAVVEALATSASQQQKDAMAALLEEARALRSALASQHAERTGSLDALESKVARVLDNASALKTDLEALPAALAEQWRELSAPAVSVDAQPSNDLLADATDSLRRDFGALAIVVEAAMISVGRVAENAGRSGSESIAKHLEALESKVARVVEESSALKTDLGALPASIAEQLLSLRDALAPAVSVEAGLSNDPPASASELSAATDSLRRDFGVLANLVEDTMISVGRVAAEGEARSGEARAGFGKVMEAVRAIQALVGPLDASPLGGSPRGESLVSLFDDMNGRLDQLLESQLPESREPLLARTAALAPSLPTVAGDAALAHPSFTTLSHQIEEIAARLDDFAGWLETLTRGQAQIAPEMLQSLTPLQQRIAALTDASQLGFDRLAGQFGQLAAHVAATPKAMLSEARSLLMATQVDLSPLQRRLVELQSDVKDLALSMSQGHLEPPAAGAGADLVALEALSNHLRAEMDALHGRLDHFASRIDQMVDLLDEAAPSLHGSADRQHGFGSGVGQDVARRIEDLHQAFAGVAAQQLAPLAQRLEAASSAILASLQEWRSSLGPATLPVGERAPDGSQMRLDRPVMQQLSVLQSTAQDLRQLVVASTSGLQDRFDDLNGQIDRLGWAGDSGPRQMMASLSQTLAAPLRELGDATGRLTRLAGSVAEKTASQGSASDLSSPDAGDTLKDGANLRELATKIDRVLALLSALAVAETSNVPTPSQAARSSESRFDASMSAGWEKFQTTIAEILFGLDARWESSLAEMRETLALLTKRSQAGESGAPSETPRAEDGGALQTALSSALQTMSAFMEAIDGRFVAFESVSEAAKTGNPDRAEEVGLGDFDEKLSEMRRLTSEFLDISCAISGELETLKLAA